MVADGIGGRAALRGKLVGHLGEQALKVVLVDDSAAPPEVALHLAQDVIEELELELADREAKRRRLVVQSSYASVLLFALAEPADLVLVRWPAGMESVAKVMSAPAEAAPNLLHVECCITADDERIRGAVPPSAVEVAKHHFGRPGCTQMLRLRYSPFEVRGFFLFQL